MVVNIVVGLTFLTVLAWLCYQYDRWATARHEAKYVYVPAERDPIPPAVRWEIHQRDGYRCVYCGEEGELQLDHVIPYSRGGPDTYENLVSACRTCNRTKGARTPQEARMEFIA